MKVDVVQTPIEPVGSRLQNGRAGSVQSELDVHVVVQMQMAVGPTSPQHSQPRSPSQVVGSAGSHAVGSPASVPPPSVVPASQVNPQNTPEPSGAQNPHSGGPQQNEPPSHVSPPHAPPPLPSGELESVPVLESTVTLESVLASRGRVSSLQPQRVNVAIKVSRSIMARAYSCRGAAFH